jgi:hypothetical protein
MGYRTNYFCDYCKKDVKDHSDFEVTIHIGKNVMQCVPFSHIQRTSDSYYLCSMDCARKLINPTDKSIWDEGINVVRAKGDPLP